MGNATTDIPIRFLLVSSGDETFCTTIRDLLEALGFAVSVVGGPVKALELLRKGENTFDVVLLGGYEGMQQELDGESIYVLLRNMAHSAKIIVCSGACELKLRRLQVQYPFVAYIRKPFRTQELLRLIYQVLGRRPPAA